MTGGGLRLALSWLTVLPVHVHTVDRRVAVRAIALSPVVGGLLGGLAAAVACLCRFGAMPEALIGLTTVAALLLLTRGMHLDGLADTMDGLGSYGSAERAREIMRSGGTGPFGVAAIVMAIGAQATAIGALAESRHWPAIVAAVFAGRVAVVVACRRGVRPAAGSGFGTLVADSQSRLIAGVWLAMLAAVSAAALAYWWQVVVVTAVVLLVATAFVGHCVRRFDGLSGDVLGAVCEITVTAYLCIAVLG